jgi:hypothetical protein
LTCPATRNGTSLYENLSIKAYLDVGQLNEHGLSDGLIRFSKQSFLEQQLTLEKLTLATISR